MGRQRRLSTFDLFISPLSGRALRVKSHVSPPERTSRRDELSVLRTIRFIFHSTYHTPITK